LISVSRQCGHTACIACVTAYTRFCVEEGKLPLTCFGCLEEVPLDTAIALLHDHPELIDRLQRITLLRSLQRDPLVRFCPRPGCEYAVVCPAEMQHCSNITCEVCDQEFCFRCRDVAHPGRSCPALVFSDTDEVKACPRCGVSIFKEHDGACNHMVCSVCKAEFCWLCLQELPGANAITHFVSLSGCTMYGKHRWSEAKQRGYRLATPITLPFVVAAAAVCIPILSVTLPFSLAIDDWDHHAHMPKGRRLLRATTLGLGYGLGIPVILTGTLVAGTLRAAVFAYLQMPVQETRSLFHRVKDRRQLRRLRREQAVNAAVVAEASAAAAATSTDCHNPTADSEEDFVLALEEQPYPTQPVT